MRLRDLVRRETNPNHEIEEWRISVNLSAIPTRTLNELVEPMIEDLHLALKGRQTLQHLRIFDRFDLNGKLYLPQGYDQALGNALSSCRVYENDGVIVLPNPFISIEPRPSGNDLGFEIYLRVIRPDLKKGIFSGRTTLPKDYLSPGNSRALPMPGRGALIHIMIDGELIHTLDELGIKADRLIARNSGQITAPSGRKFEAPIFYPIDASYFPLTAGATAKRFLTHHGGYAPHPTSRYVM